MNLIRNILLYILFAIAVGGCGGGNTTIASNASSNTTSASNSSSGSNITNTSGTNTNTSSGTTSGSGGTSTSTGSVTLQWSAPTTWADNTAASLSDISAYRLYYGPSATDTPNYVNITDGTATQYTITLPSGTYYFRIAAIDSSGYEGLKSTALQKTF